MPYGITFPDNIFSNVLELFGFYKMYDILGCSLLALVLYYNTLSAGFAYDDSRAIIKNQDLQPETPLTQIFYDDFWGTPLTHSGSHKSYRPLCVLSFRLNYALGELEPFGYHLFNVLLHTVATAFVTYTARQLFNRVFPTVLAGLLFASHPIHTEAVAGVVGRADVGACVLYLISFLCYINYCKHRNDVSENGTSEDGTSERNSNWLKWIFLSASCVATALSMLTKELGITVLAVNVTFDLFIQHHLRLLDLPYLYKKQYQKLQEGLASQLLCGGALLSFRILFMGSKPPDFAPADNPAADSDNLLTRGLTFTYLPAVNLWMLLWPHILSFDWSMESIPLVTSLFDYRNLATVLFYTALCAIAYFCVRELDALNYISKTNGRTSKYNANSMTVFSQYKMNGKLNGHTNGVKCSNGRGDYLMNGCHGYSTSNGNGHLKSDGLRKRSNLAKNGSQNGHIVPTTNSMENIKSNHRTRHLNVTIISLAFMIFSFIPASNLFFYVGFVVAERILYIPSVGFCLLVATGIDHARRKLTKFGRNIVLSLVVVQVLMYSSRTVVRNWDWHSEETLYRAGIHVNPAKAWGNLANILKTQGKEAEAEEAYRNALNHRGNMADVHYNLGILLQEAKRYTEAIESYETAIICRPRMSMAHLNLGIVYSAVDRHGEAEAVYKRAASLDDSGLKDPKNQMHGIISSLFNLGRLLHDQSRYEEALKVFLEAIDRRPDHYAPQSLYNMLGETYYKLGKLSEAETWFRESLKAKPDHVPAHLTYANLLSKTNRMLEAEHFLKRAVDLDPQNSAVFQHYGQFFTSQAKHLEAANMYKNALEHHPEDYELTFNLANALRQNKDGDQAEIYYKKAVQIQPDNASGHLNLGAMLHINNKLQEAEASYLEALRLKPGDSTTTQNLKKLRNLIAKRKGDKSR